MRQLALLTLAFAAGASPALAAEAERETFGSLPDGGEVSAIVLTNEAGMKVRVLAYGALIQELSVPGSDGAVDVVLGYDGIEGYLEAPNYFGVSVGRYANRIANGRFMLDGATYELAQNDGPNALHGGVRGFDKQLWTIADVRSGADEASVTLTYTSPDGEEGYPGTLEVSATYTLTESNELRIDYRATTDKPTIVNLTNHSYFNLAGASSGVSILDAVLTIPAESYTPVDETLIPTGGFTPVQGTAFDFRAPKRIGNGIRGGSDVQLRYGRGYDHNWVVSSAPVNGTQLLARLEDPGSGRVMEILSNQPGIQFYSGNFLDATVSGKDGTIYRQGDALCLEPQIFPDTPNKPEFGSARLDPGEVYENRIVYRFSLNAADDAD
jgi:aldose 1-epimerase